MRPTIPERGQRQLRKGRFSCEGGMYFVTTRCHDKQNIFLDPVNVKVVFDSLDWLVGNGWIDLHFAIAMPDHVHLVFQLLGDKGLPDVMLALKQFTGRQIKSRIELSQPVWQRQYYDHLVRSDESLSEVIQYCWFNPVRGGLVSDPREYPHWRSKYELG
jgi:REP element-mobilizing transposase RayT